MTLLAWGAAWLLDYWFGDPPHWPHPVRWIGNLISVAQRAIRHCCKTELALKIGGGVLWLVVVGTTWGMSWGLLHIANLVSSWLGWLVEVWMIYTVLAARCLGMQQWRFTAP